MDEAEHVCVSFHLTGEGTLTEAPVRQILPRYMATAVTRQFPLSPSTSVGKCTVISASRLLTIPYSIRDAFPEAPLYTRS